MSRDSKDYEDHRALSALELAGLSGDTPIPASVFLSTVANFEAELELMRDELRHAHAELERAREDLGEVLLLLRAQQETRSRFWEHAASICSKFADDSKVRLIVVGGAMALLLALAGVGGLSYRDGALTVQPSGESPRLNVEPSP